ncbi:MAG: hypothetical protein DMG76_26530 [Acidobacteria bacterium]|nr:MAG: hypothetical protein DMG76_26530 [Acidobacteriota bacterium]
MKNSNANENKQLISPSIAENAKIRDPDLTKNPRPSLAELATYHWQTLRDFWTAYLKRTGAVLKTYSARDPPDLGP